MFLFPLRRQHLVGGLLVALLYGPFGPAAAADSGNRFCGAAVSAAGPGDLSLEYAVQQPASMITCSMGYFLEKCGDHDNAHKVFDKCIAAGYVGAMIWKALLLDEGAGVEQDLPKAAELLHRAAVSGDPAYGPLGKMHYATVLHLGRGVEKNEAEALTWFQAAAAEGSEEAREFIKTGYHTGYRDHSGLGAGTPTANALAPLNANPAPPASEVQGQKLERREPALAPSLPVASAGMGLLLLASFLAGLLRKKRKEDHAGMAKPAP
jgi:hypothetical protein